MSEDENSRTFLEDEVPKPSEEESDDERDMDMSMFASVWVKVEVDEDSHDLRPSTKRQRERSDLERDGSISPSTDLDQPTKSKRMRKRKPPPKNLQCDRCDYRTGYKNCFELHQMGHTNSKPYTCTFCQYTTKYPTSLHRHIIIQHEVKNDETTLSKLPTYNCTECDYTTHFKWNLNAHKRKHSVEKQYKCEHCEYTTAYKHNHLKHKRVHNKDEVTYRCDKCPFVTRYEGHISRHLAKIHNEVSERANRCEMCPFSTKTKWRLNIHINRSRQEQVVKCAYCEFQTQYMCQYKTHKVCHYQEMKGLKWEPLKTEENIGSSEENVSSNLELEPTMEPQHILKPLETDFQTQSQHEKDNHYLIDPNCEIEWSNIPVNESFNQDRPFQCTMCNYTAKFKASVQRHYQRHHHQNRPYRCLNCDFSTKTKDQITLHNKRSQIEDSLNCNICAFKTNFKCSFIVHQRSHYPFKCTSCDYTCRQKYDIQKHFANFHMGTGLKCQFCDYKATRKESLLCHEMIHTGNKPFKCEFCDYKSVRRSLLDTHVRKIHCDKSKLTIIDDSKIQSLRVIETEKNDKDCFVMNFSNNVPVDMVNPSAT